MEHNWIVVLNDGKYTMKCNHCQQQYTPATPIAINLMTALMEAFIKEHKDCPIPNTQENRSKLSGQTM